MTEIYFRFYAELNDFLPRERRQVSFAYSYNGTQSVKHLIEAAGVPHPEVDLVLANGRSVDFSYVPADGDRIGVFPVFEAMDIGPVTRLRPRPLRRPCFVLDCHLGKLAGYLRLLGFDTLYRPDYDDDQLVCISCEEHRILLTKDRSLLMRRELTHAYYVRERKSRAQLAEVVERLDLAGFASPLERCLLCNGLLEAVSKETVQDSVPPRSREQCDRFWRCRGCGKIFWNGSHYRRMELFAREMGQPTKLNREDRKDREA